eukprot:15341407-Ditylum_brightwellii.AAC.1
MPKFYPKSINDIYRAVCTWERVHFHSCRHVPEFAKRKYWELKEEGRRGKTKYWATSAQKLGLVDTEGGGIHFDWST